jgi:hypothetical protein
MVWRAWRPTSTSSRAHTITRFQHHLVTLVSFGEKNEEQISTSNISKQFEDILQEEWYKIPLDDVQNLYEPNPRKIAGVFKAKVGLTP